MHGLIYTSLMQQESNAEAGYEWQLLLFFHGQQLRLGATKQRLAAAQERARTAAFGTHTKIP